MYCYSTSSETANRCLGFTAAKTNVGISSCSTQCWKEDRPKKDITYQTAICIDRYVSYNFLLQFYVATSFPAPRQVNCLAIRQLSRYNLQEKISPMYREFISGDWNESDVHSGVFVITRSRHMQIKFESNIMCHILMIVVIKVSHCSWMIITKPWKRAKLDILRLATIHVSIVHDFTIHSEFSSTMHVRVVIGSRRPARAHQMIYA